MPATPFCFVKYITWSPTLFNKYRVKSYTMLSDLSIGTEEKSKRIKKWTFWYQILHRIALTILIWFLFAVKILVSIRERRLLTMPRKGENIYKRKDGRWEGRYIRSYDSEHKAKYAYVYGKTYSEVKRKLTEQRGNVQKVQPTKNKSSTYGELLDCWLHSMQLNTKESTPARYTHLS